jgi:hypothetical protein
MTEIRSRWGVIRNLSATTFAWPLVVQASHGQLDSGFRHPTRLVGSHEDRKFAISSSVMSRRGWVLLARDSCHCSQVIPVALARGSKLSLIVRVPGMPCGRRSTTRMPLRCELGGQISSECFLAACAGP